jgi:hypothetical protein
LAASTSNALARAGTESACGVHTEKQGSIDFLLPAIQANGLTDGENMPFVESFLEGRAAMPGGAEGNPLLRH